MATNFFDTAYYLASKLAQLQKAEPNNALWQGTNALVSLQNAIAKEGYTPESHFLAFGSAELTSPNKFFNPEEYLAAKAIQANKDKVDGKTDWTASTIALAIHNAGMSVYGHFQQYGWKEGVNPSNAFDVAKYLDAKLLQMQATDPTYTKEQLIEAFDAAGIDPLAHSQMYGAAEGVKVESASNPVLVQNNGNTFTLTVDQDTLQGTTGNDTFKANVVQNSNGQQVNALGSGDELNGGAGNDTLNAKITSGAFAGGTSNMLAGGTTNMPIQPETSSIENIKLQAVFNGDDNAVYLNAKDMVDVRYIGSESSDADLTIWNMTTRRGNEQKAEGDLNGKLAETTIGMKYTNNQGTGSDFTVKFDQDYLVGSSSAVDGYYYDLLDQAAFDANSSAPLSGFPLTGVNFTLTTGGVPQEYTVAVTKAEMAAVTTHAQLVQLLNQKLATISPALENLQFKLQGQFTDSEGLRTSDRIALVDTAPGDRKVSGGNILLDTAQGAGNLYWAQGPVDTVTTAIPVSIKVELEKVGLAGEGGALVIGSMNDGGRNQFADNQITTTTKTVSGIEEFNVTVMGDKSKSSSLTGLHSTNNNLRTVNVVSAVQTDAANLTIGNTNNNFGPANGNQSALKDVKTFDASAFKGDLTLHAALTNEVVAKYLNLKDKAPADAAADNAAFMYTGGTGNDTIDLQVSSGNLAKQGTATREDMTVSIAGGAGNDTITLSVVDNGSGTLATAGTWYTNQQQNANLSISAGDGDDTIWTPGSGDVKIDAGAGNDTVYSDNSAAKAAWVFNSVGTVTTDLVAVSPTAANKTQFLFKGVVNVTFAGFEVKADIPTGENYAVTQLHINQAIKKAINDDAVLSKLLVAEDGPASTLVVKSLIDGTAVVGDLGFSVTADAISAPDTAAANAAFAKFQLQYPGSASAAATTPDLANGVTVADKSGVAKQLATDLVGADSISSSDNTITGGAGDDVLVLSTSALSSDTLVYSGLGNGTDSIVNFTAGAVTAGGPEDLIVFKGYTGVTAIYLGTTLVGGTTAAAAGEGYITIVEDAAATGKYTVKQYLEDSAATGLANDTEVGVIGVLDFGATQSFDIAALASSNILLG